jgi:predicted cupin superfamily sugar epimerase
VRLSAETPQAVVPAGVWQAAEPERDAVLCGCTVAPGFEFADFEIGSGEALAAEFPDDAALIRRLAR